ncbi:MAG: nucleotidyltransferase substrate binding protein [Bacteroidota bacterium]
MEDDLRWVQRFDNYKRAFVKLSEAIVLTRKLQHADRNDHSAEIMKEGLIQRFEYTHELAWNVMRDFLKSRGNNSIIASKDATREAFSAQLIEDGHTWMEMIKSRNLTSHTYNEETANDIFNKIVNNYFHEFENFLQKMELKLLEEQNNLS